MISKHCFAYSKIQPDKVVGWCPDGDFRRLFWVLHLQRAACSTFQTCILNSHQGHAMCRSMVDIQSVAAEIRRGKKRRRRQKETTGQKYNGPLLHRAAINSEIVIIALCVKGAGGFSRLLTLLFIFQLRTLKAVQGDHLTGKPQNVEEFHSCQENVREFTKSWECLWKMLSEKTAHCYLHIWRYTSSQQTVGVHLMSRVLRILLLIKSL